MSLGGAFMDQRTVSLYLFISSPLSWGEATEMNHGEHRGHREIIQRSYLLKEIISLHNEFVMLDF